MTNIIPLFSTHYSYGDSVITLEEAGKTKPGNPLSLCDLIKKEDLKQVVVVDTRIDGFVEGQKNVTKAGAQFVFGVKLCVCANETDKTPESRATESNVVILVKNTEGYSDLIRIYNRAWTENHFEYGRTSWRQLKEYWTPNLVLALPFFSSFIARNLLTFSSIVPDFPVPPILFHEVNSGLPFSNIIDEAVTKMAVAQGLVVQDVKSVYYEKAADYDAYTTFRAIHNHGEFQRPNVDHMCSDTFSWEEYKKLTSEGAT